MVVLESLSVPTPTPLPEVVVPNLIGLESEDAETALQALGLAMIRQGERFDDKIPAGRVAAQTIPSNTPVQWGEEVGVLLSKGAELVPALNVVGLAFVDAQDRLNRAGLAAYRQEAASRSVAAGLVISQTPEAATALRRGSIVTLTVSLGNKVTVPDLMGKQEADAQRLVVDSGLATSYVNYQADKDVPAAEKWRLDLVKPGAVLSQDPAAGSVVERGTTVYLAVRKR
jgi:serine/threonine-protein kinase